MTALQEDSMPRISAFILTFNEERKIEEAVKSVAWADEVVVADSHSTDRTVEIAERLGARVVEIPFEGFGKLRNDAVAKTRFEWIFSLDADERCTDEVRDEIRKVILDPGAADAYLVPRRNLFMGKWIRHSGWYPDYRQPQLFRRGAIRYVEDLVHERYVVQGRLGRLRNAIWQEPFKDLSEVIRKMDRYSSLGAERLSAKGVRPGMGKALFHGLAAFVRHYVARLGFLDGWPGFVIALGNFEGTFYRYAKQAEAQRERGASAPRPS